MVLASPPATPLVSAGAGNRTPPHPLSSVASEQGEGGIPKCLHASVDFKALQQLTKGAGTCLDQCGTENGLGGEGGRAAGGRRWSVHKLFITIVHNSLVIKPSFFRFMNALIIL